MKFEKKIDSATGKALIYLNLEGLKLKNLQFDYEPLLYFKVETYDALRASKTEKSWNDVFGVVHDFLNTLSKEHQSKFATLIIFMHYKIDSIIGPTHEIKGSDLINLESDLSLLIAQFVSETKLAEKLIAFVTKNIHVKIGENVGERPQDTEEMTFYYSDAIALTGLVLLCKMLTPVFGLFLEALKKSTDGTHKEIHCLSLLKDTFAGDFEAVANKLINYIANRVTKNLKTKIKLNHTCNGLTLSLIIQQISAQIIVRRFVSVSLTDREKNNLITYVATCATQAALTQFSGSAFKVNVNPIKDPRESTTSGGDDGNVSALESQSQVSDKTADVPILIMESVRQTRSKFIRDYEMDEEIVAAAESYYLMHPVGLNIVNSYILGVIFGDYICGAKSIELVENDGLATLIAVGQIYLISQDYADIAVLLSLVSANRPKTAQTSSDVSLKSAWRNNFEYRNCDQKFNIQVNDLKWCTALEKIVTEVTSDVKLYQIAPAIWDYLKEPSHNGDVYDAPEDLLRNICGFLLQIFPLSEAKE